MVHLRTSLSTSWWSSMFRFQVCQVTSLGLIVVFPRYCPLWSIELCHDFVFKRCLRGRKEEWVFKSSLTSTPNQCQTIGRGRNIIEVISTVFWTGGVIGVAFMSRTCTPEDWNVREDSHAKDSTKIKSVREL